MCCCTHSILASVQTGIDVLQADNFKLLQGKRIGLISNHSGLNLDGISTVKLLHDAKGFDLVAVFSPEHGFTGLLDEEGIADHLDSETGIKIYSLYGKTRRPTAEMLSGIDTLVFDIQDIGTRFYTYISTMGYAMQVAAEMHIDFIVLDRPNPINGISVSGPMLDKGSESFVAFHSLPIRHGMTIGELAKMFAAELNLKLNLQVVSMQGWQRKTYLDATRLRWVNPSPNIRNLTQAILYPGIGLLETTNLSVGRGTAAPFEFFGAPWIDKALLTKTLNDLDLPGVHFSARTLTPTSSKFSGEACHGVNIKITDRAQFDSVFSGLNIALVLHALFPEDWDLSAYNKLLGNIATWQAVKKNAAPDKILAMNKADLEAFLLRRSEYLLYL